MLPAPPHAPQAEENKGNAEQLAHVEEHAVLEIYLVLLGVLDEDAAGEYHEEAETEEEARADLAGMATVEHPADEEEAGIAEGFVELARMAGQLIYPLEDECPREVGRTANDLAVHKVAQSDGAGADGN